MRKELIKAIEDVYRINLGIKKDERVLVFTDTLALDEVVSEADKHRREGLVNVVVNLAEVGRGICEIVFLTFPSLKGHGMELPREVWLAAFGARLDEHLDDKCLIDSAVREVIEEGRGEAVDAVIALSNFSTSHTQFRNLLTNVCGARYASMPLFEEAMFYGAMAVDGSKLAERTNRLAATMDGANEVSIKSPNGTDIRMQIGGRNILADTGIMTAPGSFGNLPAGEVYLAPVEGKTEGNLILDWGPTHKLASPVCLEITNGVVKKVTGNDPFAAQLEAVLEGDPDFRNIAELGIGTNDRASRPDNILEAEKILGTIHIALGDNSNFGGKVKTSFHQDFVVFEPTVTIHKAGQENAVLKDGRLLID